MPLNDTQPKWHIEYDHEFARWYRQKSYMPFLALFVGVISFILDAVSGESDIGTLIGFVLIAYAFVSYIWRDYLLKAVYQCKQCSKKLQFSEPENENEIRYFCFGCRREYRVRTDGKYDVNLPTNSQE